MCVYVHAHWLVDKIPPNFTIFVVEKEVYRNNSKYFFPNVLSFEESYYLSVSCSILIKVCVLLRNRFQEIRDMARGTLVKITETLGCRYLQYLLKEMQSVLVKGYQV